MIKDNIYILNLQASKLVNNNFQINNNNLEKYLIGIISFSKFLIKMQELNFKIVYDKRLMKYTNYDVINVNFDNSLKEINSEKQVYIIDKKNNKVNVRNGEFGKTLKNNKQLRKELYDNGFLIDLKITGKKITYLKLTHTSSKARVGSCTFINEKYAEDMIAYLRMNKDFEKYEDIDWVSLNAYESLVMSSINKRIKIPKDRICLIADEEYPITLYGDVVELDENNNVIVNKRKIDKTYDGKTLTNCIFDGEGLKDITLSTGHSIDLLRNSFAKSCTLETDILSFMLDNNVEYFEDMFGKKFYKDNYPLLILTPSSIKLFKFKKCFNNSMEETWNYYLENCDEEWGIVKNEKQSKYGKYYNQITYQVLNSIKLNEDEVNNLLEDEYKYIELLKKDLEVFKHHISDNQNDITKNFIISMLNMNSDFQYTEMFINFRKNVIQKYTENIKSGNVKVKNLDYHIMISLPDRLLRTAAKLPFNKLPNKYDCYTTKYKEGTELFTYRNPHISAGNICLLNNTYYTDDLKYFTLNDNVIIVNNANSDCTSKWNGADFDSDCIGVTDSKLLINAYRNTPKFELPINNIPIDQEQKGKELYELDDKIANNLIGEVCNLASLLQSIYFDGNCKDDRIPKYVSILAVASNCEIDGAKRLYKVKTQELLNKIRNDLSDIFKRGEIKVKKNKLSDEEFEEFQNGNKEVIYAYKDALIRPMFLKYAQSGYTNYSYQFMNCTIDIIIKKLVEFNRKSRLRENTTIPLSSFIIKDNICRKSDRNQIKAIQDILKNYKANFLELKLNNTIDKLHKKILINDLQKITVERLAKKKIKKETIYTIIYRIFIKKDEFFYSNRMITLEFLLYSHPKEYKECFKQFENNNVYNLISDENGTIDIWGYKYTKEEA